LGKKGSEVRKTWGTHFKVGSSDGGFLGLRKLIKSRQGEKTKLKEGSRVQVVRPSSSNEKVKRKSYEKDGWVELPDRKLGRRGGGAGNKGGKKRNPLKGLCRSYTSGTITKIGTAAGG